MFYEMMDVSLAQIFGAPHGVLRHYEVAAFCKEVLEGLSYIHKQLKMAHGDLTAENVLLSSAEGAVKIGIHSSPGPSTLLIVSQPMLGLAC